MWFRRSLVLSVIIPTYNEEAHIERCLSRLKDVEVIVVDACSSDATPDIVRRMNTTLITTKFRNRGYQLNLGAQAASGRQLLFLHADSLVDETSLQFPFQQDRAYTFLLKFDPCRPFLCKLNELGANLRTRLLGWPYGDQGLCITKAAFDKIGGYPPLKQMEDVAIIERIQRTMPLEVLNAYIVTSARKYQAGGWARTTADHWRAIARWKLFPKKHAAVFFVKNPDCSSVKTRLAKTIGTEQAKEVYQLCLQATVAQAERLKGVEVFFATHEDAPNPYVPNGFPTFHQGSSGLGSKMLRILNRLLHHYESVAILGSDAPTLPDEYILDALNRPQDFVLGPTRDKGYYLIAARKPVLDDALDEVRFSSEHAFQDTAAILKQRGTLATLPEWYDIDEYEDLKHWSDGRIRSLLAERTLRP